MKSFTVESILGVHRETTLSAPGFAPVHHGDVTSDEVTATRQQQLHTEPGLFCEL